LSKPKTRINISKKNVFTEMSRLEIVIDSREQLPLKFRKEINVIRGCLSVGDYACKINGILMPISFERKNISDLFGTLSGGYERFKHEINRASEAKIILVLAVEVPLCEVLKGHEYSTRSPQSLVQQCFTIMIRYKVPCMFFHDRRDMAGYITQVFLAIEREQNGQCFEDKRRVKKKVATGARHLSTMC
jgi:ERCC4-type nuclease